MGDLKKVAIDSLENRLGSLSITVMSFRGALKEKSADLLLPYLLTLSANNEFTIPTESQLKEWDKTDFLSIVNVAYGSYQNFLNAYDLQRTTTAPVDDDSRGIISLVTSNTTNGVSSGDMLPHESLLDGSKFKSKILDGLDIVVSVPRGLWREKSAVDYLVKDFLKKNDLSAFPKSVDEDESFYELHKKLRYGIRTAYGSLDIYETESGVPMQDRRCVSNE